MLKKIKSWRVQGRKQASLVLAALEILALLAMQTPTVSAEAFDTDAGTPQRLWTGGSGDSWEGWELWEPWEPDGAQEPEEPWEQEDPWEPEETREFWKTGESDELLTNLAGTGPAGEKEELRADTQLTVFARLAFTPPTQKP